MKTEIEVVCYKYKNRVLYYQFLNNPSEHFVPKINWSMYLQKRYNVPSKTRIYDTIEKTEEAIDEIIDESGKVRKEKYSPKKEKTESIIRPCHNSKCIGYNELLKYHCTENHSSIIQGCRCYE